MWGRGLNITTPNHDKTQFFLKQDIEVQTQACNYRINL